MNRALYCLIAFSIFSSSAQADDQRRIYGSVGILNQNLAKFSKAESGAKSFWGDTFINWAAAGRFGGGNWLALPMLTFTLPSRKTSDSETSKGVYTLSFSIVRKISSFELHLGPGLMLYRISGPGGEIVLNNGNSIATFYAPNTSSTARLLFWAIGGGWELPGTGVRFDLDSWVTSAFGNSRAVNLFAYFSLGFL